MSGAAGPESPPRGAVADASSHVVDGASPHAVNIASQDALEVETRKLREDYARNVDNRLQAAALGVLAAAAMLYPLLMRALVAGVGLRAAAAAMALLAAMSAWKATDARARWWRIAATLLALAAAASGSERPLLLLPALLYGALSSLFLASLREKESLVERAARTIQPAVPDFIAPWCRGVTMLWGVVFAASAVVLAVAAFAASPPTWEALAGRWLWTAMGAITAVEFLARKTHFRNYWYRGPFEQVWSRLFPAEATEMGRRSAEHIRQVRQKLGLSE